MVNRMGNEKAWRLDCGRVAGIAALVFGASAFGCSAHDVETPSGTEEPVGETQQPFLGRTCTSNTGVNCWMVGYSGPNFRTMAFGYRLGCGVQSSGNGSGGYTYRKVWCGGSDGAFPNPAAWGETNSEAPNDIKSIAIMDPFPFDTSVYILGNDNVVRRTTGDVTISWFGGTNFKNYFVHTAAATNTGGSICLQKIDVVTLPSIGGPNKVLVGLTCGGKLVYSGFQGSSRVWFPSTNALPWSNLSSSLSFTDMGHSSNDTHRLYLLDTTKRVWRVGAGTANPMSGIITWSAAQKLPLAVSPLGLTVNPIAVGGRFIITDAGNGQCSQIGQPCWGDEDRFYWFANSRGEYVRQETGTASLPGSPADVKQGQPYRGITDAGTFMSSNGEEMGVWHVNHRVLTYAWQ